MNDPETIRSSIDSYLRTLSYSHRKNTVRTYQHALADFVEIGKKQLRDFESLPISEVLAEWVPIYSSAIQNLASSTRYVYLTAIKGWYTFLVKERQISIDLNVFQKLIETKLDDKRLPTPIQNFEISRVLDHISQITQEADLSIKEKLRIFRDKALLYMLADTGLDVQIICELKRENFLIRKKQLHISMKDNKRISLRITPRLQDALSRYLDARSTIDNNCGKRISDLPLFARHDLGIGANVEGITSASIRNIVKQYVREALGAEYERKITARSFKTFFISSILETSLELLHPKILDKCQDHFEHGKFDDAIFNAMKVVEEEIRSKAKAEPIDVGIDLITKVMNPKSPTISFSSVQAEKEAAYFLYRGTIGFFKNPNSHRFLDSTDPIKTYECLALSSLLMRMLDEAS